MTSLRKNVFYCYDLQSSLVHLLQRSRALSDHIYMDLRNQDYYMAVIENYLVTVNHKYWLTN